MALSMDEQRILDEIERGLASADPVLASRLSSFGFQRATAVLRIRRARMAASFLTLLVVAAVSLVVYVLVPFRAVVDRHGAARTSASPSSPALTVPGRAQLKPASAVRTGSGPAGSATVTRQEEPRSRAQ